MQKKRFSLPKFCLDARKSNSPFDVRCPLFGGQWQDMYFNTQNRDTYPIWSQGSSSHVAKHIPHSASPFPGQLSALRRQTRGSIPRDPTCPFQSSHCRHPKPSAHQPLEQMIFCLILGFKQDSHNCLQPPMSRGYSMHSHGTAPGHFYCFRSSRARGCSDIWCFWPGLFTCLTVREWTEVMERWIDQECDFLWHLCYIVAYLSIMGRRTKCFLIPFSLIAILVQSPAWQEEKSTSQARLGCMCSQGP